MEIKFRGKQVDSGEWYHGYYVKAPRWGDGHYIIMDYHGPSTIAYEVDGDTVGIYTGLKDKNGVEIFVSDIVRILHSEWGSKGQDDPRSLEQYLIDIASVGCVDFEDVCFGVRLKNKRNECSDDILASLYVGDHGYIEVIGNIHDNPDLLKEVAT